MSIGGLFDNAMIGYTAVSKGDLCVYSMNYAGSIARLHHLICIDSEGIRFFSASMMDKYIFNDPARALLFLSFFFHFVFGPCLVHATFQKADL